MYVPIDKAFHFIVGWMYVATLFPYFPIFSLCTVIFFAWLKEWWDGKGHGTKECLDFLVTIVGGFGAALTHDFFKTILAVI